MKIPNEVNVAGIPVKIIQSKTLAEKRDVFGLTLYKRQEIVIDTSMPKETYEQTLMHELLHYILFVMGEEEINRNEKLVDLLAHLIYQVSSQIYIDPSPK